MTRFGGAAWPYAWRGALLLAAGVALALQLAQDDTTLSSIATLPATSGGTAPGRDIQATTAAAYAEIAAHPLFDASRAPWRPPPPPPAVLARAPLPLPPPAPLPPRGYALIGLVSDGSHATALLRGINGRTVLLTPGQMLDGWQVRAIDHGRVRLQAQGATFEIAFPGVGLTGRPRSVP